MRGEPGNEATPHRIATELGKGRRARPSRHSSSHARPSLMTTPTPLQRVFRMWINSLGIEDLYVNNLFEDLRNGVVLLKVMDYVQPGCVNWRKVNLNPKNKFKKVENANYAVVIGKQLGFSLVGIGGVVSGGRGGEFF